MVSKKTSRSPKSPSSVPPAAEVKPTAKVPAKAPRAAKAPPAVTPRKRPVAAQAVTERVPAPLEVTDDEIRVRAYYLSLEYRGANRNDVDFWLLAERELRSK